MSKELEQHKVTVEEIFLFFKASTQPPVQWVPATRCSAEVKNEWSYTSTSIMSLCAFMAWTGWTLLFTLRYMPTNN